MNISLTATDFQKLKLLQLTMPLFFEKPDGENNVHGMTKHISEFNVGFVTTVERVRWALFVWSTTKQV